MAYRRKTSRNDEPSYEHPTYSRLFIVTDRKTTEDELREAFMKFGIIEDIRMPRDHNTGQAKGIAFVKFSKTSEAAFALEELNRKALPGTSRPLKVMVAANRSEIQTDDDEEKYKRLFITVSSNESEEEIKENFVKYGTVENVRLQRNRDTNQSKGFAYVKFRKFSEAALAFEQCNLSYRAIFALPKNYNKRPETSFESTISSLATSSNVKDPLIASMNVSPAGYTRVNYICCPFLTQKLVERLFDVIPGMLQCQFYIDNLRNYGKGKVTYSNPFSATYAVKKLNGFEYPPGVKIWVKPDNQNFDPQQHNFTSVPNVVNNLKSAIASSTNSTSPDLAQLAKAIAEASKLLKMATTSVTNDRESDKNDINYCSVKLPDQQPLADIDSPVAKRCFLVCKPHPPPLTVLRDIFCRFGNLINVYTLPGKTVGYARYASIDSADNAISTLHGAEICGVRIKVLEAEDEAPPKRARYSDNRQDRADSN